MAKFTKGKLTKEAAKKKKAKLAYQRAYRSRKLNAEVGTAVGPKGTPGPAGVVGAPVYEKHVHPPWKDDLVAMLAGGSPAESDPMKEVMDLMDQVARTQTSIVYALIKLQNRINGIIS